MGRIEPIRNPPGEPHPLHEHAMEQLRYIRSTMERAGSFTAVPGMGGVVMGLTALGAAWMAHRQTTAHAWMTVWLTEMVLAFAIGSLAMFHKARRSGVKLWSEPGRKFASCFLPAVLAGAALTWPLFEAGLRNVMAGAWLLLYGVGVIAGGAFSVRIVPAMGVAFLALGLITLRGPVELCDFTLAAGFGGLHIVFGWWIYRRYGG